MRMHTLKPIRANLGATQKEMADGIGCSQGNVANYERGQTLPPDMAKRVIDFAASRGLPLTMGQIYGMEPLPEKTAEHPAPVSPTTTTQEA